ncbi:hypothetical protein EYM_04860 [Ignicoccus islandicus DSM 13165]|uniref:Thioredoxin domain-containing protein n=1 Tax=Ignicoccus islandicus DSM 13165 TaxID=940295 RepID=A0A0U2MB20_9CREN|nr:thioredoxin family protein [Ignicoccus islandicus]ALU12525.1 hypothetical protein EYM_04860 [Ignicoccus islandicus DSM 13165]
MIVKSEKEYEELKSKGVTAFVFTVDWIEESKRLYEKLVQGLTHINCKVVEVDVSLTPSIMEKENVVHIPTVIVYIDGKEVIRQEGSTGNAFVDMDHLRRALKESMKKRGIPLRET